MIATAKKYDYWLIVWITSDDEEIHQLLNFRVGIHPKDYCDAILKFEKDKQNYRLFMVTSMREDKVI